MEFRLTYAGQLLAHRDDNRFPQRALHVHSIRKEFHKQLKLLWAQHPVLATRTSTETLTGDLHPEIFDHDGFKWCPLVTDSWGLICKLEILMLREGIPGRVLFDIDNRLKTLFDALRMAKGPKELGDGATSGRAIPDPDEKPFYVLLQDDRLITHVAVTSDTLLEPVPNVPRDTAVRLVIDVTVRPYDTHKGNLLFG